MVSNASDSNIRQEVIGLLKLGPRKGASHFVKRYGPCESVDSEERARTIISALCAENSVWIHEFKKRILRKAKCSPQLRCLLVDCVIVAHDKTQNTRLTATDVLRRTRIAKSSAEIRIKDQQAFSFGTAYSYLLAQLSTILKQKETPVDITIAIDCDHVYVHGLGLLAAWCVRYAANVQIRAQSNRVDNYLIATGFKTVVEERTTIKFPKWDGHNHVAITQIDREDLHTADEVSHRLIDLFHRHTDMLDKAAAHALHVMFAELIENVYRHSQSNYPGIIMAQAFPNKRSLHVIVVDTGIGVYDSFRQSDKPSVRDRVRKEEDAIYLALEKLVTSKTSAHAGYGLFLVKSLVIRNGGTMRLTSGRTTWQTEPGKRRRFGSAQRVTNITSHLPWRGTEVSLVFQLDNDFPILEVYRELGRLDHEEDFFD